jgi:hypothetical protein
MTPPGARCARAPRASVAQIALACQVALCSLSCSAALAPLMTLPTGPGAPAADAADVLAQATAACRAVRTLTAEIALNGTAGGRRLRGRLSAGVAAPASVRLEAAAPFGPPVFIFVAVKEDATLLLPRDARALEHGRPEDVLEAIAGAPLTADDVSAALVGCAPAGSPSAGRGLGDDWRAVRVSADGGGSELYLHRDRSAGPWRLVAMNREGGPRGAIRIEYGDFHNDLPQSIRLKSLGQNAFDLALTLSQVDTNTPLEADVFRIDIPPSAAPITVEELRNARLGIREN